MFLEDDVLSWQEIFLPTRLSVLGVGDNAPRQMNTFLSLLPFVELTANNDLVQDFAPSIPRSNAIYFHYLNLEITITFDSLDGFSSSDPKNEALGLFSRFMMFKYEIIF